MRSTAPALPAYFNTGLRFFLGGGARLRIGMVFCGAGPAPWADCAWPSESLGAGAAGGLGTSEGPPVGVGGGGGGGGAAGAGRAGTVRVPWQLGQAS